MNLLLALLFCLPASSRVEAVRYQSDALRMRERYQVYLPPGFDKNVDYPVIVLLHGLGGLGSDWFDPTQGDLQRAADTLIRQGVVRPFIAIAPDGHDGYWTDHISREPGSAYGRAVIEALDDATKRYPIRGVAAIVGASAGGHGAMSIGLANRERFRAIVSMSGALFDEPPTHRPIYLKVWGDPPNGDYFARTAPVPMLKQLAPSTPIPAMWISVGKLETERFMPWNVGADALLTAKRIPHVFNIVDGGHGWSTWRAQTTEWLVWVDALLRR